MSQPFEETAAAASVERFVRQLVVTYKAVVLYPPASTIPRENAVHSATLAEEMCAGAGDVPLAVGRDGLRYAGEPVLPGQTAVTTFARELYHRAVAELRFCPGVTPDAVSALLEALRRSPEELDAAGGLAARLREAGIDSVTVLEASVTVVEAESDGPALEAEPAWPPEQGQIERLLAEAKDPRSEEHSLLVRVLVDENVVTSHVNEVFRQAEVSGESITPGNTLAAMARVAVTFDEETRSEALRALAGAARSLPPGQLRARTAERVLSAARTDRGVADFVRQVGVDEVCRALTEAVAEDETSADGLARAIRNLAQISLAGLDEVTNAAGAAMRGAGLPEPTITSVLASAAPRRIVTDAAHRSAEADEAVEYVMRLVEIAPQAPDVRGEDPGLSALREEAHTGLSDGDVIGALVMLAVLDLGTSSFDESMSALEDGLVLLLDRGEFEVAAEAADTLLRESDGAEPHERQRVLDAVKNLAGAREMRALHRAMHVYERESSEYVACRRLLATLGSLAIDPLLEMLADEPEMSRRKSMVELISSVADDHVEEVGRRITDPRWYFVRNVVSILGSTKRSETVPFLGRTLRHTDARIRRESIRALSGVRDPRATELVMAALDDVDAGNVQLAARYLGTLKEPASVAALVHVALGEGNGNRDHGPRAEAIEALGLIGSVEALPALESIAGRRRLISGSRAKGLAGVASAAIDSIESGQGGVR